MLTYAQTQLWPVTTHCKEHQMYVAIQQIGGAQPTDFMKLSRPMSAEEIKGYCGKRLPLDEAWMRANGYTTIGQWASSPLQDVCPGDAHGVLLLHTRNSVYQAIPDFAGAQSI